MLRKITKADTDLLVIKDVTSILSMNRDTRNIVLGALREVFDGYWQRNMGADGGRSLSWRGRVVLIGAVTSAWDSHHAVIAQLGERFVLIRTDSSTGREEAALQAMANLGHEGEMREELAQAVGLTLAGANPLQAVLDDACWAPLIALANLVTLARSPVDRDHKGEPTFAHMPESPTRLVKSLGQLIRGGQALGADLEHCMEIAIRVAADTMPPLRLDVLWHVAAKGDATIADLTEALDRPRTSVARVVKELAALRLLRQVFNSTGYQLTESVDRVALRELHDATPTDISGHAR